MDASVFQHSRPNFFCYRNSFFKVPRVAARRARSYRCHEARSCRQGRWRVGSSAGGAVWPDDSSRQYNPNRGPDPPDMNDWFQRVANWIGSAIQGISDSVYDMCPPKTSRQLVDNSVRAGLTLLALAFARSILTLVMTGGIVGLFLYIIFRGFGGNGDYRDEPRRGNSPPTEKFENGKWTVVQPTRSSRGQWKSAQNDLVEVWIDDSDEEEGRDFPR
ncbi:hypothetical protein BSKO_01251 [Bryopsis sp. KO-2023]|nr:hypothetical protein BSKO_01251 [Bryopsis sp. KO-2023]